MTSGATPQQVSACDKVHIPVIIQKAGCQTCAPRMC